MPGPALISAGVSVIGGLIGGGAADVELEQPLEKLELYKEN